MRITDKLAQLPGDASYYSFEFFPPKTQAVIAPVGQSLLESDNG